MRSPRCSISTIPARRASGCPTSFGGRENLEAIAFLRELNGSPTTRSPGILIIAEESTSWPQVTRPTYVGGLGFDLKWNMGWMNDTLRYMRARADPPPVPPGHADLQHALLRSPRTSCCRSPTTRSSTASTRCSTRCPATNGKGSPTCACSTRTCSPIPARSCCSWAASSAKDDEWNERRRAALVRAGLPLPPGIQRLVRDLNALYTAGPALHRVDFEWQGFDWIDCHDAQNSVLIFLRKDGDEFVVVALNFTPVPARGLPHRRSLARGLPRVVQLRLRRLRRQRRRRRL